MFYGRKGWNLVLFRHLFLLLLLHLSRVLSLVLVGVVVGEVWGAKKNCFFLDLYSLFVCFDVLESVVLGSVNIGLTSRGRWKGWKIP